MRSMVDLQSVESFDGRRAAPPEKPVVQVKARRGAGGSQVRTARNTVDVRGQRVHEAESAVEELLRGANGPVWVIHGIGTGRLKRGLRQWLDSLPYVERVGDADQGDGGPGCSVVWVR
jgi:DNA mismatch repair protein MutS2